jgi:hypothetical protein
MKQGYEDRHIETELNKVDSKTRAPLGGALYARK